LDKLLAYGFDRSLKNLFIREGVTMYLDGEEIEATLTWVRTNTAPGSSIIFDYQDISTLTRCNIAYRVLNRLTSEKRVFGIEKEQVDASLTRKGFIHLVDVTVEQLESFKSAKKNTQPYTLYLLR
jgi:O-methyltransferase involved in polyketide biosynthesis